MVALHFIQVSCLTTIGCELFQTFQDNFQKRKGQCNGKKQSLQTKQTTLAT